VKALKGASLATLLTAVAIVAFSFHSLIIETGPGKSSPHSIEQPTSQTKNGRIPEEAANSSESISSFTVHVFSKINGKPISGAQCQPIKEAQGSVGEAQREEYITNDQGLAVIGYDPSCTISVSCDHFIGQTVSPAKDAKSIKVWLSPSGPLRGKIVDRHGNPAPKGVTVLATQMGSLPLKPNSFTGKGTFWKGSEVDVCQTDSAGEFTFLRLDPSARYRVRGLGKGIATNVFRGAVADTGPIRLMGGRICAIQLLVEEHNGDPPQISPHLSSDEKQFGFSGVDSYPSDIAFIADPLTKLAGVPPSMLGELNSWKKVNLFRWIGFESGDFCEVSLAWKAPGYIPVREKVRLPTIKEDFPVHRVLVERNSEQFGGLEVVFQHGLNSNAINNGPLPTSLYVELLGIHLDSQPNGRAFSLNVSKTGLNSFSHSFIPVGRYRASLISKAGLTRVRAQNVFDSIVEVFPDRTSSLEFDLSNYHQVEVLISNIQLETYDGLFWGELEFLINGNRTSERFHFSSPPYIFGPLPEGEYSICTTEGRIFPKPIGVFALDPSFQASRDAPKVLDFQYRD
jgi:hypothetical protein